MKAVVLLSGGIDSTTTLAIAKNEGYDIYALSFDYGQRHKIELSSAIRLAEFFHVSDHRIISTDLRKIGGSALTADIEVPKKWSNGVMEKWSNENPPTFQHSNTPIPITYVPARNTIFLSFALGYAEVIGAGDIFIGANAVDYSGYPDCRPEYLKSFEDMANLATKASVEGRIRFRINAPLIYMTKAEIITKGIELGVDYALTWSCYDPQERQMTENREQKTELKSRASDFWLPTSEYVPCGRCDSCILRAKGFKESGVKDPLIKR